jgi:hypothetical protein
MDSTAVQWKYLTPLNPRDQPLASQHEIVKVYQSSEEMHIPRHKFIDVSFIFPIQEVESG